MFYRCSTTEAVKLLIQIKEKQSKCMYIIYAHLNALVLNTVPVIFPVMGSLGLVGFDAANVVRSTLHQLPHQLIGLSLEERREREREGEKEKR